MPHFDALPILNPKLDAAELMEISLLVHSMSMAQAEGMASLTVYVPVERPAAEYSTF